MPTVQQIIDYADRKYPNQETDANKILDLDDIHTEIYVKIARLKNDIVNGDAGTTTAGKLTYALPYNCTIDNIVAIKVSQSATVTSTTEWDTFEYAGLKSDIDSGCYYGRDTSTTYVLTKDGAAINTTGLQIMVYYYRKPTALAEVTDTPELDSDYHNLLKYALIQSLSSQGQSPDTEIADYWQRKANEFLAEVENNLLKRYNKAPTVRYTTVREEWG